MACLHFFAITDKGNASPFCRIFSRSARHTTVSLAASLVLLRQALKKILKFGVLSKIAQTPLWVYHALHASHSFCGSRTLSLAIPNSVLEKKILCARFGCRTLSAARLQSEKNSHLALKRPDSVLTLVCNNVRLFLACVSIRGSQRPWNFAHPV